MFSARSFSVKRNHPGFLQTPSSQKSISNSCWSTLSAAVLLKSVTIHGFVLTCPSIHSLNGITSPLSNAVFSPNFLAVLVYPAPHAALLHPYYHHVIKV